MFQGQTHLLKKLFYKLDPAVVKGGFDVEYGQVKLAIKYASRQQLLLVKVLYGTAITYRLYPCQNSDRLCIMFAISWPI